MCKIALKVNIDPKSLSNSNFEFGREFSLITITNKIGPQTKPWSTNHEIGVNFTNEIVNFDFKSTVP